MKYEKIRFPNRSGHQIGARLDLPDNGEPVAYAIFAHCFTCHKNLNAVRYISQALTDAQIGVFRFDFTGLGESEGDFADTNFSSNIDDLVAAADYVGQEYVSPKLLIGHSLGGAAVLQAAHQIPSVKAVVTIGAPSNPQHVTHLISCSIEEIEKNGVANVVLAGRPFTIKKQFLDDLADVKMRDVIQSLNRALLVCHSPFDDTVGIDNAAEIFMAARHPKSFVSLDQADHLLTDNTDAKYVGRMIGTWASAYLAS